MQLWEQQDMNSEKLDPKSYQFPVHSWLKISGSIFGYFLLSFPRGGTFLIKKEKLGFPLLSFIIDILPYTLPFSCPHQKENNQSLDL